MLITALKVFTNADNENTGETVNKEEKVEEKV